MGPLDALCRRATSELSPGDLLPYVQFGAQSLAFFPLARYLAKAPVVAALAALRLGRSFVGGVQATPTPELALALGWSGEPAAIAKGPLLGAWTSAPPMAECKAGRARNLVARRHHDRARICYAPRMFATRAEPHGPCVAAELPP